MHAPEWQSPTPNPISRSSPCSVRLGANCTSRARGFAPGRSGSLCMRAGAQIDGGMFTNKRHVQSKGLGTRAGGEPAHPGGAWVGGH